MTNTLRTKAKEPLSFPWHFSFIQMVLPSLIQFYLYLNGIIQIPKIIIDGNQCKHAKYQTLHTAIIFMEAKTTFISIQFPKHSTLDIMWNRLDGPNYLLF